MDSEAKERLLAELRTTKKRAEKLIEFLQEVDTQRRFSMTERQRDELSRYLRAHSDYLDKLRHEAKASNGNRPLQAALAFQFKVEEALQFVYQAFIQPRTDGRSQQILEAADWLCVEGFLAMLEILGSDDKPENRPIGPLVAIDARQSPAVWSQETALPLPSLFQRTASLVSRGDQPDADERSLAYFSVICLPATLIGSPGSLPLLSHEVGHALDNACDISKAILRNLRAAAPDDDPALPYWQAWMREMVADLFGILISGEAFAVAFADYVRWMPLADNLTTGSTYPGITLRLELIWTMVQSLGRPNSWERHQNFEGHLFQGRDRKNQDEKFVNLRTDFGERVLPEMLKIVGFADKERQEEWCEEQVRCWQRAACLAGDSVDAESSIRKREEFRLLPSVITLLEMNEATPDREKIWQQFSTLHEAASQDEAPAWVSDPSNWRFTAETLPTLRPTFRSPDGIKVPPAPLLVHHERIAFVGATNGQLLEMLKEAFENRDRTPWQRLELFFAGDDLLQTLERNGDVDMREERDQAERELIAYFCTDPSPADDWAIYSFDGRCSPRFGTGKKSADAFMLARRSREPISATALPWTTSGTSALPHTPINPTRAF